MLHLYTYTKKLLLESVHLNMYKLIYRPSFFFFVHRLLMEHCNDSILQKYYSDCSYIIKFSIHSHKYKKNGSEVCLKNIL